MSSIRYEFDTNLRYEMPDNRLTENRECAKVYSKCL